MSITHHATLVRTSAVRLCVLPVQTEAEIRDEYIERFGIDDARELVRLAYNTPAEAAEQLFVIRTEFVTLEAQNALLKILEEPPVQTKFVFVIPQSLVVLDTIRSRVVVADGVADTAEPEAIFAAFQAAGYADRLAQIEQATKKKDTAWQHAMKYGLIARLAAGAATADQTLEYVARTLLTRGASNKMLLEQLAMSLPLVSR